MTTQLGLFDAPRAPSFGGKTYVPARDGNRLRRQLFAVKGVMADGKPHTLREISALVSAPEASVSARLRDLRKPQFGNHTISRRFIERGLFEYRMT